VDGRRLLPGLRLRPARPDGPHCPAVDYAAAAAAAAEEEEAAAAEEAEAQQQQQQQQQQKQQPTHDRNILPQRDPDCCQGRAGDPSRVGLSGEGKIRTREPGAALRLPLYIGFTYRNA
jgi:hypothetical protein